MEKKVCKVPEAARYMRDVKYLLIAQKVPSLIAEHLRLELYIYPPDRKKRDIDNLCKAVLDALQTAKIYRDDFFIDQLYVERREVRTHGEVEFILRSI